MTNEKEWWKEKYSKEVNGDCSRENCWFTYYDIPAILAEAERRTIEKVEEMVKGYENCEPNDSDFVRGCKHAYDFILSKLSEMKR